MKPLRVVVDTNTLVSSLLFRREQWSWLREAWRMGTIVPVLCPATTLELVRVLSYPKFHLSALEQKAMMAEILPYCETAGNPSPDPDLPPCRDRDDQVFIELTLATRADYLVSGDGDLQKYPRRPGLSVIAPSALRELVRSFSPGSGEAEASADGR